MSSCRSHYFQSEALAYLTHRFAIVHTLLVLVEVQHFSCLVEDALQQFVISWDCMDNEGGAVLGDHKQDRRFVRRWSIPAFNNGMPALVKFMS